MTEESTMHDLVYERSSGLIARAAVYVDLGEGRAAAERLAEERA